MKTGKALPVAVAAGCAMLFAACGGSSTSPSPPPNSGGGPGPVGATITINANGALTPSTVTINPGESVTFVNNHNRGHQMASDPHPDHTACPAINVVGTVDVGQSRTTNALTTSRTCGIHDHTDDTNPNLRGSIVIR